MQVRTVNKITVGDIIVTKDKGEHLVLRVRHNAESSRLRTVDIATGIPKTRVWSNKRACNVDAVLSSILS